MPELKPVVRPQPNKEEYNVSEIQLFPRLNRKLYRQIFGEQAPPWDQSRPIQRWFDTATPANTPGEKFDYLYVGRGPQTRKPEMLGSSISVLDMRTPNLPGVYDYPDWVPAETEAYVGGRDNATSPLNSVILSTREQARDIMMEVGAVRVVEAQLSAAYRFVYPSIEDRRVFNVVLRSGARKNVGRLLTMKYKEGIGAPGKWSNINPLSPNPVWISDEQPTGEWDPRPEVPIPCRPLHGNEELGIGGGIAAMVVVRRTDLGDPTLRDVMRELRRIAEGIGIF